ncbi:MAG: 50S ribosomal protein L14e [Candidatus Micrarchaeia archaeon]
MALIEVGRVCIKKFGRDAGSRAVITKINDGNFVSIITSDRQKERKCNTKHLEFLGEKIDISDKAQIEKALETKLKEQKENKEEAKVTKKKKQ